MFHKYACRFIFGAILVLLVIAFMVLQWFKRRKTADVVKTDEMVELAENEDIGGSTGTGKLADKDQRKAWPLESLRAVTSREGDEGGGKVQIS